MGVNHQNSTVYQTYRRRPTEEIGKEKGYKQLISEDENQRYLEDDRPKR